MPPTQPEFSVRRLRALPTPAPASPLRAFLELAQSRLADLAAVAGGFELVELEAAIAAAGERAGDELELLEDGQRRMRL